MKKVVFVAYHKADLLDVTGPLEVFYTAGEAVSAAGLSAGPAYDPMVASRNGGPIRTSSGADLGTVAFSELGDGPIDTLLVSGGIGCEAAACDEDLRAWLSDVRPRVRRFGSICTGALILASAGLLRNYRATTHWEFTDAFGVRFPDVKFECDALFVEDGGVWTSAGVAAGIDMALAMVEQDYGTDIAIHTAKHLVLYLKRSGGQSPFSGFLTAQSLKDARLRKLASWIVENPAEDLSLAALAARAHMSLRTLHRAFREESGASPRQFVERARLDFARRLLEQTNERIEQVAQRSGFVSTGAMRSAFHRILGVTPVDYRERFSGTAPVSETNRIPVPSNEPRH